MRVMEWMLGIDVPGYKSIKTPLNINFTSTLVQGVSTVTIPEVKNAISQAMPILFQIAHELNIDTIMDTATFSADSARRRYRSMLTSTYDFLLIYEVLAG